MRDLLNTSVLSRSGSDLEPPSTFLGGCTDVFDLPFHIARDQIEQSLRAKMASIKECMVQLQEGKKEQAFSDSSDRALKLEAQLVEARSIISEQVGPMSA
jgi:X breakpoint 2-interacting protein